MLKMKRLLRYFTLSFHHLQFAPWWLRRREHSLKGIPAALKLFTLKVAEAAVEENAACLSLLGWLRIFSQMDRFRSALEISNAQNGLMGEKHITGAPTAIKGGRSMSKSPLNLTRTHQSRSFLLIFYNTRGLTGPFFFFLLGHSTKALTSPSSILLKERTVF